MEPTQENGKISGQKLSKVFPPGKQVHFRIEKVTAAFSSDFNSNSNSKVAAYVDEL